MLGRISLASFLALMPKRVVSKTPIVLENVEKRVPT